MKTKLRKRIQWKTNKPSMTQQHLQSECDIHNILKRYQQTGFLSHVRKGSPLEGDFSAYSDFKSNLDMVKEAYQMFDELPAQVRKRFSNDPSQLIEFVTNSQNDEEAIKLGLKVKPVQQPKNDDKTTIKPAETQPATDPSLKA